MYMLAIITILSVCRQFICRGTNCRAASGAAKMADESKGQQNEHFKLKKN
jgi:hypothetical protein